MGGMKYLGVLLDHDLLWHRVGYKSRLYEVTLASRVRAISRKEEWVETIQCQLNARDGYIVIQDKGPKTRVLEERFVRVHRRLRKEIILCAWPMVNE